MSLEHDQALYQSYQQVTETSERSTSVSNVWLEVELTASHRNSDFLHDYLSVKSGKFLLDLSTFLVASIDNEELVQREDFKLPRFLPRPINSIFLTV